VAGRQAAQPCEGADGWPLGLVTLCGVWQHIDDAARQIAMACLGRMISVGGLLVMSLRHGPGVPGRRAFPVSPDETIKAAIRSGFALLRQSQANSIQLAIRRWGSTGLGLPSRKKNELPLSTPNATFGVTEITRQSSKSATPSMQASPCLAGDRAPDAMAAESSNLSRGAVFLLHGSQYYSASSPEAALRRPYLSSPIEARSWSCVSRKLIWPSSSLSSSSNSCIVT
jgi:hypothetical protein